MNILGKHSAPEIDSSPTAISVGSGFEFLGPRVYLQVLPAEDGGWGVEEKVRLKHAAFSSEVDIRVLSVAGSLR